MPHAGKTCITFCIPNMIIGGVETVFIQTLDKLARNDDFEINVLMHCAPSEPMFNNWFATHPNIKLHIVTPLARFNKILEPYTSIFPLKNIRRSVFSLYKKYCRFVLRHSSLFRNTDIFIDYKNFAFYKELLHCKQRKIAFWHSSFDYFTQYNRIKYISEYDALVCLSDEFKSDFETCFPDYANKVVRIYNPLDVTYVRKNSTKIPKKYGKYFCSVGRLDSDKDPATILRAFELFYTNEHRPDVKLLLVGDGELRSDLEKIAKSMQSGKQIVFVGSVSCPFGYMRGAMAHILSSFGEGFGMVLVEAAAVGTLNISSRCKSAPSEILENGAGGILFTPGNEMELAQAMSDVYNKRIDITGMKAQATRGLARFQYDTIIQQITELLRGHK